jgi:hypothetical protein
MIPMPMHATRRPGTRADRNGYLSPMAERWPGGTIADLVTWMDVEGSERWRPYWVTLPDGTRKQRTYCDHYAADFVWALTGRQLTSAWVWWSTAAEKRVRAGETVAPVWNKTVIEYGARGLHQWMGRCGHEFGWTSEKSAKDLQAMVDQHGTIGLILTPSHVAVVVPSICAEVLGAELRPPVRSGPCLTSQAGARNFALSWESDWFHRRTDTVFVWLEPGLLGDWVQP